MKLSPLHATTIPVASLLFLLGCGASSEPSGAQTAAAGSAGMLGSAGTAGMATAAAGAQGASGAAGSGNVAGAGGAVGAGGMPAGAGGAAGGAAGAGGAAAGSAGAGGAATAGAGGDAGASGAAGAGGQGAFAVPRGMSAGCGNPPPGEDSSDDYVLHEIAVPGVDPAFIAEFPPSAGNNGGYDWENRNYYVRLPQNYNPDTPYAVTFGGGGCGNTGGDSGQGGGQQPSGIESIQIGMSYVYNGGACFEDDHANTPEVPYFDAMMAEISANYCVNLEKVFVGGWSSGAWEAYTLGFARGGVIRGIAAGAGGLREERPPPSGIPMAAILLTGANDEANPIDGDTGSALARDLVLMTNGCVGTDTMPFTASDNNCVQYTGCPAEFPVVWCTPNAGHVGGDGAHWAAVGAFWDALPPVP